MNDPRMNENGSSPFPTPNESPRPQHLGTPPRPPPRRSPTPSTAPVSPSHSQSSPAQSPNAPVNSNTPSRSNTPVITQFCNTPPRSNTPRSNTPVFSYTPPRSNTPAMGVTSPLSLSPLGGPPASAVPAYLTPSINSSRRSSLATDIDSRRESVNKMASGMVKDLRKGVKNVSDNTKKAGSKVVDQSKQLSKDMEATTKKVKDRTAMVGTSVKGASHWVAAQTSKSAKQAMLQARSGLSLGEKTTLFLTEKISAWSKKGFTHVFMFLMIAAYTALGAALFIAIEGPHETIEKLEILAERDRLIKDLYVESRLHSEDGWAQMAKERLQPYEAQLYKSYSHGVSSDTDSRVWTFWKAMFFCSTITTTIGYGHMAPVTTAGRSLCIVYAIIGIPLMLILMADFGKLFTRILKSIFRLIARINRSARCIQIKNSSAVTSCRNLCRKMFFCPSSKKTECDVTAVEEGKKGDLKIEQLIVDDHFNLPISLALFILVIYILAGCIVFPIWEDWSFFEAFYFIFISISTIGFGDFVPQHPGFMMATTVYFVFGLALTAMCINIIQEKLTDTFREASAKMKQSFGKIMEKAEQEALEAAEKKAQEETEAEVHQESSGSRKNSRDDKTSTATVSDGGVV